MSRNAAPSKSLTLLNRMMNIIPFKNKDEAELTPSDALMSESSSRYVFYKVRKVSTFGFGRSPARSSGSLTTTLCASAMIFLCATGRRSGRARRWKT